MKLLSHVQDSPDLDPERALGESLTTDLHGEVAAMNRQNFIVRMHLEAVDHFREREAWDQLSDEDRARLTHEVAGLPSEVETDEIESRLLDLTALRMQLALAEGRRQGLRGPSAANGGDRIAARGEEHDPRGKS